MEKTRSLERENKMGSTPMLKLIMMMSLPAMFSMLISALYNIVDSMFVAQIGQEALTAVSLAYPLQMLLVAVSVGTGVGINSLVSRKLGEGNKKAAESAVAHGVIIAVACWVVFLLVGIFATESFIKAYTDNALVYEYGVQYTSTVLIFSIGIFVEIVIEKSLQATGNMLFPMLFQLSGAVINIILDPVFIFGFGPVPAMGVLGAAVATVIGQIISAIFAVIVLFVKKHEIKITFKNFRFSLTTIKNIYAVGLPAIVMQSILSVLVIFLNSILMTFSEAAVNVLGIYYKLQSFIFMPVFGLTQGIMPIIGYNYGAKNRKRMISALKYGMVIATVILAVGTILFWAIPEVFLSLFNATPEVNAIGVQALRTISIGFIPAAISILFTTLFQATGKGLRSLFMSVLRQLILILPLAYIFSTVGLGLVWYAFPLSEIGSLVAGIVFYINLNKKEFKKLG